MRKLLSLAIGFLAFAVTAPTFADVEVRVEREREHSRPVVVRHHHRRPIHHRERPVVREIRVEERHDYDRR